MEGSLWCPGILENAARALGDRLPQGHRKISMAKHADCLLCGQKKAGGVLHVLQDCRALTRERKEFQRAWPEGLNTDASLNAERLRNDELSPDIKGK